MSFSKPEAARNNAGIRVSLQESRLISENSRRMSLFSDSWNGRLNGQLGWGLAVENGRTEPLTVELGNGYRNFEGGILGI